MKKHTQTEIVVLFLASHFREWVSSYDLSKKETGWGWLGSQGDRRARELATEGKYELDGRVFFIERRHLGKYAEYRVAFSEAKKPKYRYEERNGVMVEIPNIAPELHP